MINFITSDTYSAVGDTIVLICGIRKECLGYHIMWQKHEENYYSSSSRWSSSTFGPNTLKRQINNAELSDSGFYWCKVWKDNVVKEKAGLLLVINGTREHVRRRPISPLSLAANISVVLEAEPGLDQWTHYNEGNGAGWRLPSTGSRRNAPIFEVCDVNAGQPISWLRSPFIQSTAGQQWITMEMEYSQLPCTSFRNTPGIVHCNDSLNVMLLESDVEIPLDKTSDWDLLQDQGLSLLNTITSTEEKSGQKIRMVRTFQPQQDGFYLVLQDMGSCTWIYSLKLYFKSCRRFRIGLTVFPETFAPAENHSPLEVSGECVEGGRMLPSDKQILSCDSNGHWIGNRPSSGACVCMPGYIHVRGSCMKKGPRCYSCVGARTVQECGRETTVDQCRSDEVCGMENVVNGALNKGCIKKRDNP